MQRRANRQPPPLPVAATPMTAAMKPQVKTSTSGPKIAPEIRTSATQASEHDSHNASVSKPAPLRRQGSDLLRSFAKAKAPRKEEAAVNSDTAAEDCETWTRARCET